MPLATPMRRCALVLSLASFACCFDVPTSETSPPETDEVPIHHQDASATCIATYEQCRAGCASSQANCDLSFDTGLCFPNPARVRECHANCAKKAGCMPWEIGVETGEPCRWSDDPFECNFFLCSFAATACLDDCFDLYKLTDLNDEYNQIACQESCYDHYGCRPRPSDPCTPLPEGYIHCACPNEHGVECHPNDGLSCP